jgi:hypothetical protein
MKIPMTMAEQYVTEENQKDVFGSDIALSSRTP